MKKRTIWVKPSRFIPEFEMIVEIPDSMDDEEYINQLLNDILKDEYDYNVVWDFVM